MKFRPTFEDLRQPEQSARVDYDDIDRGLVANIEGHLSQWFTDKQIKSSGGWYKVGNNGSLAVNMQDGHWHSHETQDKGKGLLSLYAWQHKVDLVTASEDLSTASKTVMFRPKRADIIRAAPAPQWEHSTEIPIEKVDSHFEYGDADAVYKYRTAAGDPVGVILRWDKTDTRGKEIRPVSWVHMAGKTQPEWKWCGFAEPRPLYRGEQLAKYPDKPVIIVEGEKCADVLQQAIDSHIVLTWCGGTGQVGKADFSHLAGRDVTIWPDNDGAGIKAASQIKELVPSAKILDIPAAAPEKWDAADAIDAGMDGAGILKLIATADLEPLFVDLESIFDGNMEPERPTVAITDSGESMLYAGRINEIHGEPSVGKTNINIAIMACELRMGNKVVFIDPEDNPNGMMRRMLSFGLSKELIVGNMFYLHDPTPEELIRAQEWTRQHKPTLVALDGLAETITACRYKEDSSSDVLEFFKIYIRPFADAGAAVNLSDHVVKSLEGRGLWSRGSGAKMGRYDGVSYNVTTITPYSPTQAGSLKFAIAKDRNGGLGAKGEEIFIANFTPNGNGQTDVSIRRIKKDEDSGSNVTPSWRYMQAMHATIKASASGMTAREVQDVETRYSVNIPQRDRIQVRNSLVQMGLIEERKDGKQKVYKLTNKAFPNIT